MTPWLFSPNNSAFLYLISFASSESKCVLPLVCLYLRHIVTQMHVFLPFSEPIFIFIGIYTVKCMRKLRTPRAFHLQTAAPHQPPLVFYLSVFFFSRGTIWNNQTSDPQCLPPSEFIHDVPWKCLGINHFFPTDLWPLSLFISPVLPQRGRKGREEKTRELAALGGGMS